MFGAFKLFTWQFKLGISIALLVMMGALYYVGYTKGVNVSRVEIAKYQGKVEKKGGELAKAQAKVDVQTIIKYKDRVVYLDKVITKTRTVVEQSVPEQFHLSRGWIYAYNQSVQGLDVDSTLASDDTPSTTTEMRALAATIVPNNGIALSNAAQLEALQTWVRESAKAREKVNEK